MKYSDANTPLSAARLWTCGVIFDAASLSHQLTELETKLADPSVWSDQERSQQLMRQRKRLENSLAMDTELGRRVEDIAAYFDLAREGEAVVDDLKNEIDGLRELAEKLETETLLSAQNHPRTPTVTIHPATRAPHSTTRA